MSKPTVFRCPSHSRTRLDCGSIHTEAIADAIWHSAVQFDVDQTALEDAFAAQGWSGGTLLDFDTFMDKVEAGIARELTLEGLELADFIAPRTCLAIGAYKRRDTIAATVLLLCRSAPGPVYLDA